LSEMDPEKLSSCESWNSVLHEKESMVQACWSLLLSRLGKTVTCSLHYSSDKSGECKHSLNMLIVPIYYVNNWLIALYSVHYRPKNNLILFPLIIRISVMKTDERSSRSATR
jgi:hypothetical protein